MKKKRKIYLKKNKKNQEMKTFHFFLVQRKKICLDDKYQNNHEISGSVQRIRKEQKCHQHIFCKKLV